MRSTVDGNTAFNATGGGGADGGGLAFSASTPVGRCLRTFMAHGEPSSFIRGITHLRGSSLVSVGTLLAAALLYTADKTFHVNRLYVYFFTYCISAY
jgi:hypothetical protein